MSPSDRISRSVASKDQQHTLIPIRVDYSAPDPILNLRIIDTFLIDPLVWPLPVETFGSIDDAIRANADYIAQTIVADSEVIGMGRTIRHFTGRLDFWSWPLVDAIRDQIIDQFQTIIAGQYYNPSALRYRTNNNNKDGERNNNNYNSRKRKAVEELSDSNDENKERKTTTATPTKMDVTDDNNNNNNDTAKEVVPSQETENNEQQQNITTNLQSETEKELNNDSNLIPIALRLTVNGVRIHDNFDWDPTVSLSPLEMAYTIGYDLNLNDEIIQAIAIEICEQIQRTKTKSKKSSTDTTTTPSSDPTTITTEGGPTITDLNNTTAAWFVDPKANANHITHFLSLHNNKPSVEGTKK